MKSDPFTRLKLSNTAFYSSLVFLSSLLIIGLFCAYTIETKGHWITGMNNQVIWGIPHVIAIFLIITASGTLNIASIGSLFNQPTFKPLGRISGLMTIGLLIGGLSVLVLDLGRPDRLIIAITHYNFKSIFAWNIFLYTGFLLLVVSYLWSIMEKKAKPFVISLSVIAFLWRICLTSGTGLIFGFLIAREAYDSAIMAPLFIAMSLSFGAAIFILVVVILGKISDLFIEHQLWPKLQKLLAIFIASNLYLTCIQHLTAVYATEHHSFEKFILINGGGISFLFWFGQVLAGSLMPLAIIYFGKFNNLKTGLIISSFLVILGGISQLYVIIVGGQSFPLILFPGKLVSSSFYDGTINPYSPTFIEFGMGFIGFVVSIIIVFISLRVLNLIPLKQEPRN